MTEKDLEEKRELFLKVLQDGTEKVESGEYEVAEGCIRKCLGILKDRKKLVQEIMVLDLYSAPVWKMEIRLDTGNLHLTMLELVVRKTLKYRNLNTGIVQGTFGQQTWFKGPNEKRYRVQPINIKVYIYQMIQCLEH